MTEKMSLDQIDDLCDAFEAALRRGEPAQIEDYLGAIPEEQRPKLFRELLEIEVEFSAQRMPTEPSSPPIVQLRESLKNRFPEHGELVDSVVRRVAKLRQIGDYEIIEELGHGGMGVVYKARQKLLNQTVAIKVLSQTLLDDPQAVGRFRREMQLIGGLNHPNIVRALNAGEIDGAHYLVMEFVDGITLQRLGGNFRKERRNKPSDPAISRPSGEELAMYAETVHHVSLADKATTGRVLSAVSAGSADSASVKPKPIFPVSAACEAIRQAALGLQHAHEFGLVHRDIKPANLMLDRRGTVKILDLGLGKFLAEQRPGSDSASLTMAGTTIGTIDYISPEQCENAGDVDIRADIYSLGCTLYFLLTGNPPYSGSRYDTTRKKLMAHIVGDIPKLQKHVPDVPDELEAILEKMLAKEPEERFQTPAEVAEALEPFASFEALHEMIGGTLSPGKKRSPGSTSRITGTSNTRQAKAVRKTRFGRTPGRDAWLTALPLWLPLVLGLVVALLLPGIYAVRSMARKARRLENRQRQQALENVPIPVPAANISETETQRNAVLVELAQLPGLNGAWWFDEMPWLLPVVREALLRQIAETDDWKARLGGNPDRIYDPNVPAAQDWIWNLVQQCSDRLAPGDRRLAEKLKEYYDSASATEGAEQHYRHCLDSFLESRAREADWNGAALHTRALLEHRLAAIRNDRELADVASKRYDEATARYRDESLGRVSGNSRRGDESGPAPAAAEHSRRLEFLCLSDAARLEYLAYGNYARAIRKFGSVMRHRESGERTGTLFRAELYAAQGSLGAEAGQYDDSLFTRGMEMLNRSNPARRLHPLSAMLAERYAWSLLDQWKVVEAGRQFESALVVREANRQVSKNRFAIIPLLHDLHGLALALRYGGNTERAVEEYRKTLDGIDRALEEGRATPSTSPVSSSTSEARPRTGTAANPEPLPGIRRYTANLYDRAANTRERLADCTLYGGAASGAFSSGRLSETAKLYEEAAESYLSEGSARTMRGKQAIVLLLQGEIDRAERILGDLDGQKRNLLGNQVRAELVRQVADALLAYRKTASDDSEQAKQPLRQFLRQFTIPTNPVSAEAERRETLELRLFCGEFLVSEALDRDDFRALAADIGRLMQPIGVFMHRPESRPYLRRICDLIIRTQTILYERSRPSPPTDSAAPTESARNPETLLPGNQAMLESIVRLLEWIRLQDVSASVATKTSTADVPESLVVFFLTYNPADGFVVFYPLDGRIGDLYRLPLTRRQIKRGARKQDEEDWKLDPRLLQSISREREAGRYVRISWNDEAAWARTEAALTDADWPFDRELKLETAAR